MKDLKNILAKAAVKAMQNSYSPYSKYRVGAAVLGESGKIYSGTNVENASYGLAICAERTAIFTAVAAGERKLKAIAIALAASDGPQTGTGPCGACRQVMAEFMGPNTPVYMASVKNNKIVKLTQRKFKDYYPYPFGPENLGK